MEERVDRESFDSIVLRYRAAVISYISNIIPNNEDAEDLCQETFQKCYKNLSSYNNKYAFSTWLFTIAQNTALDFLRKKRVTSSIYPTTGDVQTENDISSSVPSPEEKMINEQAIEKLLKSIQNLPGIYRRVAELRFIHDYPIEEISKELNIPSNTVKTRISRAKKLLNEIWRS